MKLPIVAIMPAYKPDARLASRAAALLAAGFASVVVVDDGSGPDFSAEFDAAERLEGCTVLRHDANAGKGVALKTAFAHVMDYCAGIVGVVTADADGQHIPDDCRRVAEVLAANPSTVVLGVRDFHFHSVPFRSWWGNIWTARLFAFMYGTYVPDTQTGLRGFGSALLPRLATVPGKGYEYEMAVLCRAARSRIPFSFVPIRTIYEAGNASSHFSPLRDTMRVHRVIFANLFSRL